MRRIAAIAWLLIVLCSATHVAFVLSRGLPLQTDLMALLPREEADPLLQGAKDKITDKLMGRVLILASHEDRAHAQAAIIQLETVLRQARLIQDKSDAPSLEVLKALGTTYFPFRAGLLAPQDHAWLQEGTHQPIIERARAQIFGFSGISDGRLLISDPFLLFPAFLASLPVPESKMTLDQGVLTAQADGKFHAALSARITGSPTSLRFQDDFVAAFEHVASQFPSISWSRLGGVFYAQASTKSAMKESGLLSAASFFVTVALLTAMFRSVLPVLLGVLVITTGLLCATSLSLLIFGSLHVAAQLFGASLIGVAVDYATIYFGQIFTKHRSPEARLKAIFVGLSLGMLTTVIGYLTLAFAPFPGLHQVAIFSSIGLLSSFLSVVLWFPYLDKVKNRTAITTQVNLAQSLWASWKTPEYRILRLALVATLSLLALLGYSKLRVEDDVRRQQSLNAKLVEEQKLIQSIVGFEESGQFFIIRAGSEQEALERGEILATKLRPLKGEALGNWISASHFVPSGKRQSQNHILTQELMQASLQEHLEMIGLERAEWPQNPILLSLKDIQSSATLPVLNDLILSDKDGEHLHLVILERPQDRAALQAAAATVPGVAFIDPAADYTALFKAYRERSVLLLIASVVLISPLLIWRYGMAGGLKVLAPPVAALLLTPGLLALFGQSFTFFAALGLVMILAMGVDYAVFCAEDDGRSDPVSLIAVGLAMTTAVASFGFLSLSEVAAVRSFGMTMATGLPIAYLLAPFAGSARVGGRG